MMTSDYSPKETLDQLFARWWWVAVAMLVGGLLGWLSHFLLPPVYEVRVGATVQIDYLQATRLSEFDLDQIQEPAGQLLVLPEVRQRVFDQAQAAGLNIDPTQVQVTLERRTSVWLLRLRYSDPDALYELARIWGETYAAVFAESHQHASRASTLGLYLTGIGRCIRQDLHGVPFYDRCVLPGLDNVNTEFDRVWTEMEAEMAQSRGIYPGLLFDYTHPPEREAVTQSMYRRGALLLAGMAVGFVIGVALSSANLSSLARRARHG